MCYFFFFFKQKTAYEIKECDWSSDVCSSDLERDIDVQVIKEIENKILIIGKKYIYKGKLFQLLNAIIALRIVKLAIFASLI